MPSTKTTPVAVRLKNETVQKARANASHKGVTLSVYLGRILEIQINRKR
jgi:predicted DNA binding CopG/RHH family protein